MSRHSVDLEPAFILSQRPYRDSSRLLEVLTLHHGRIGLVARGVRARKSRLGAALQSFAPMLLSWRAAGELGNLACRRAARTGGAAVRRAHLLRLVSQ